MRTGFEVLFDSDFNPVLFKERVSCRGGHDLVEFLFVPEVCCTDFDALDHFFGKGRHRAMGMFIKPEQDIREIAWRDECRHAYIPTSRSISQRMSSMRVRTH